MDAMDFLTDFLMNFSELNSTFSSAASHYSRSVEDDRQHDQILVNATVLLLDQDIAIELQGLAPFQKIKLQAEMTDEKGAVWSSWATFQADGEGRVLVSKQEPLDGTYDEADGMGLFWSMTHPSNLPSYYKNSEDAVKVELTLLAGGNILSTKTIYRLKQLPDVKKISILEGGIVGTLFVPTSDHPLPIIVTLTGSNGGISEGRAKLLSAHGFATLALAYFNAEGLPRSLENIPMEYFEKTFAWIKSRPDVDGSRIGIYGISRGGELSLVLGTLFPGSIQAIVSGVPSSVIYSSINGAPAWTYQGKAVGLSAPIKSIRPNPKAGLDHNNPIILAPQFIQGMKEDPKTFAAAAIPVEKITCPLLLISGGDDQMWPSTLFCEKIKERLAAQGSVPPIHLDYPKAGHQVGILPLPAPSTAFSRPLGGFWFSMGGSPKEDDHASRDSWRRVVTFFEAALNTKHPTK